MEFENLMKWGRYFYDKTPLRRHHVTFTSALKITCPVICKWQKIRNAKALFLTFLHLRCILYTMEVMKGVTLHGKRKQNIDGGHTTFA